MWGSHGWCIVPDGKRENDPPGTAGRPDDTTLLSIIFPPIAEVGLKDWREFANQVKLSCLAEKMTYTRNDLL
jgi:hypothetical protein